MKKILFTFLFLVAFIAGYTQMANNGGTITVESGAVLVIEGDYTSTGAGIIKIDGDVQLKGNFINNSGTIDAASAGTLTFNGTGAQQIGGTASTTFNCLVVVNNSNGVSLTGADAVLAKALTLTSGKLTLNAYDLTMAVVGITVTSGNWVVTNNAAGELKGVVGASPVTFPVGSATSYNPVILDNTGGTSDTYGVVYTAALPAGFTPADHAVTGNWAVSEAVATGSNLTVTPQWNTTPVNEELLPFDRTDCAVGVSDGTSVAWSAGGAAVANGSAWTRSGTPFTTLGAFVVGDYFYEGIDLDLDMFLAGPYSGGTMSTALNSLLPTTDPYGNIATATPIPSASVVDWIEVELRSAPATTVQSYSFFVDNGGNVLNVNGNVGAKLTGIAKGSYYVAVRHRNHLGAMTASAIDFTAAGPFAFDFTNIGSSVYGTNPLRNISGVMAMWAGDTDGDGDVEFTTGDSDITPVSAAVLSGGNTDPTLATAPIYSLADADMNGTVQFTTGTSDITPVSASVLNNPANVANDPTLVLTQQLP